VKPDVADGDGSVDRVVVETAAVVNRLQSSGGAIADRA